MLLLFAEEAPALPWLPLLLRLPPPPPPPAAAAAPALPLPRPLLPPPPGVLLLPLPPPLLLPPPLGEEAEGATWAAPTPLCLGPAAAAAAWAEAAHLPRLLPRRRERSPPMGPGGAGGAGALARAGAATGCWCLGGLPRRPRIAGRWPREGARERGRERQRGRAGAGQAAAEELLPAARILGQGGGAAELRGPSAQSESPASRSGSPPAAILFLLLCLGSLRSDWGKRRQALSASRDQPFRPHRAARGRRWAAATLRLRLPERQSHVRAIAPGPLLS